MRLAGRVGRGSKSKACRGRVGTFTRVGGGGGGLFASLVLRAVGNVGIHSFFASWAGSGAQHVPQTRRFFFFFWGGGFLCLTENDVFCLNFFFFFFLCFSLGGGAGGASRYFQCFWALFHASFSRRKRCLCNCSQFLFGGRVGLLQNPRKLQHVRAFYREILGIYSAFQTPPHFCCDFVVGGKDKAQITNFSRTCVLPKPHVFFLNNASLPRRPKNKPALLMPKVCEVCISAAGADVPANAAADHLAGGDLLPCSERTPFLQWLRLTTLLPAMPEARC